MTEPITPISKRVINECDRCGEKILAQKGEQFTVLKANNLTFDTESYTLEFFLCSKCRRNFKDWIMNKGDDTT